MPQPNHASKPEEGRDYAPLMWGASALLVASGAVYANHILSEHAKDNPPTSSFEEKQQELLGDKTDSAPVFDAPAQPNPGSLPEVAVQGMPENSVVVPGQSVES